MGRSPCCDKVGLKKGPWTPEEDEKLLAYIEEHGHGSWRSLPEKAGLQRCGKSCRLRWTNYLRPDIKRGKFTLQEEQTIIQLHALLGNRWSAIATHLPKRTDNEIKNYWNTHLKKKLVKMGIDPVTHKPKNETLLCSNTGRSKNEAALSHMAQWESARLEAEARLAAESKLRLQHYQSFNNKIVDKTTWNKISTKSNEGNSDRLESPTSTVTLSENVPPLMIPSATLETSNDDDDHNNNNNNNNNDNDSSSIMRMIDFVGSTLVSSETGLIKDAETEWKSIENSFSFTPNVHELPMSMEEGFTSLLLIDSIDRRLSENAKDSENNNCNDDNKNYWDSILNLVDSPL